MAPTRGSKKDEPTNEGDKSHDKEVKKTDKDSKKEKKNSSEKHSKDKEHEPQPSTSKQADALEELVKQAKNLTAALEANKDSSNHGDVSRMFRKRSSSENGRDDKKAKHSKHHDVSESESDLDDSESSDDEEEVSTDMDIEFSEEEKDPIPRYSQQELMLKLPRAEFLAKFGTDVALTPAVVSESLQSVLQAMLVKADETRGPKIDGQLIPLIDQIWKSGDDCELVFEKLESRIKQPANLETIRYVVLNGPVKNRARSNKFINGRDIALSAIQKCVVKGGQALCILMDQIASKTTGQDRKDMLNFACDVLDCIALASGKLSMSRKYNLRACIDRTYLPLLRKAGSSSGLLLGENLPADLKACEEDAKLTRRTNKRFWKRGKSKFGYKKYGHKNGGNNNLHYLIDDFACNDNECSLSDSLRNCQSGQISQSKNYLPSNLIEPVSHWLNACQEFVSTKACKLLSDHESLNQFDNTSVSCRRQEEILPEEGQWREEEGQLDRLQTTDLQPQVLDYAFKNQNEFKAEGIKQKIHEWTKITSDAQILDLVHGVKLEFKTVPCQFRVPNKIKFNETEAVAMDVEIQKMVKKGVIEEVEHTEGEFLSNLFTLPKRDSEDLRCILNLTELNQLFIDILSLMTFQKP